MSTNQADTSAILNLLTAIAALFAVGLAVASELRAQKRFKQGNEIQERIAAANIKPLLDVDVSVVSDEKRVTLLNEELGTAVITEMVFRKGDRQGNSMPSVIDLAIKFRWGEFTWFGKQGGYLRAGDSIDLLFLSIDILKSQGLPDATIDEILRTVGSQIKGMGISIRFEDILGNRQANYETILE
jgi:hypothetical protein